MQKNFHAKRATKEEERKIEGGRFGIIRIVWRWIDKGRLADGNV